MGHDDRGNGPPPSGSYSQPRRIVPSSAGNSMSRREVIGTPSCTGRVPTTFARSPRRHMDNGDSLLYARAALGHRRALLPPACDVAAPISSRGVVGGPPIVRGGSARRSALSTSVRRCCGRPRSTTRSGAGVDRLAHRSVGARAHLSTTASTCSPRSATELKKRELDCILVDEAQFLTPRPRARSCAQRRRRARHPRAMLHGLRTTFAGNLFPGSACAAGAGGFADRTQGGVRMRAQGDDEPARRCRGPRRRRRRADRDRRQRPLHRPGPCATSSNACTKAKAASSASVSRAQLDGKGGRPDPPAMQSIVLLEIAAWLVPLVFAIVLCTKPHGWVANRLRRPRPRASRRGRPASTRSGHVDPGRHDRAAARPCHRPARPCSAGRGQWPVGGCSGCAGPGFEMVLVALAGPGMNLLLALLCDAGHCWLLRGWCPAGRHGCGRFLFYLIEPRLTSSFINIFLAVFNHAADPAVRRRPCRRGAAAAAARDPLSPNRTLFLGGPDAAPAGASDDLAKRQRGRPNRLSAGRAILPRACSRSSASACEMLHGWLILDKPVVSARPRR